ncbi:Tetratricopeptide repeat-like superfamily protein [Prunus dulcis]|uniref:Tetratricopeptide repeat-like superfamily protein n=2 Tax=Prunus dulcis TaxID=3755 RepID=A0A5H2XWW1_PRUDU|nr:Tetratricopeptide repeat-like superfamily protein [Prunus dulcis]
MVWQQNLPAAREIWKDYIKHYNQCTTFGLGFGEENVGMDMLDIHISQPVTKILRWSFSDVIHPCARLRNGGLAEELILQRPIIFKKTDLAIVGNESCNMGISKLGIDASRGQHDRSINEDQCFKFVARLLARRLEFASRRSYLCESHQKTESYAFLRGLCIPLEA